MITQKLKFNYFNFLYKDLSETTVGNRIAKARLLKGYTQSKLASILIISHSTVADYEMNKCYPSPKLIIKIAKALDKPIEYFYDDYYKFIFSDFGKKIKAWRTSKGLTLWEAGKITNIDYRSIGKWENGVIMGRPYFEKLRRFIGY